MPASTVASSSFAIFGPPNKDGSQFVRNTLNISDGSTQTFDQPNVPGATDLNANLAAIVAGVGAALAAANTPAALNAQAAAYTAQGNALLAQAAVLTAQANAVA